jgi:hypothetical protein
VVIILMFLSKVGGRDGPVWRAGWLSAAADRWTQHGCTKWRGGVEEVLHAL